MKVGIAVKLGLLLALVGMLAAGVTGFYAYNASRDLLVDSAKNELLTSTHVLARRITLAREELSRNLQTLAGHPAALLSLQGHGEAPEGELATLFRLLMEANPEYFQIRLISAADGGLERIRIDRDGNALVRVSGDELQEKGHYPYVFDTLSLHAGQTYLSRVVINHEHGSHSALGQPSVQLAMPVADQHQVALGVVVINVDLNGLFTLLATDLPQEFQLFFANRQGDFLIHPDSARSFGFDKGRRVLIQDEFPATAELVEGRTDAVLIEARAGSYARTPVVAAFIGRRTTGPSNETGFILGLAQPLASVVKQADALGTVTLQIVLGLCLASILVAVPVARAVTRPINSMSAAVQGFTDDQWATELPQRRQDEIGVLARSFCQLRSQIRQQLAELQQRRVELEHLAQHDTLTGLPNRALFADRMELALSTARRDNARLALLFIDLDRFKPINDRLGHATGDLILKGMADRIRGVIRESDTAARIGGDEFIVLLRNIQHREDAENVADKIREAAARPFACDGQTVALSVSIGFALYPDDGADLLSLSKHADKAMYCEKSRHRGPEMADRG